MEVYGLEEKKAIKGLEWSQQQMRLGNLPDYDQGHYADIRIILNLIEKQSKEIEELKLKNEALGDIALYNQQNSVSKDKIKAKIEEYENKIKKIRSKKVINEPEDTINITRYAHYISVLQSLLEKE